MEKLKNSIEKLIYTSKYEEACELVRNEFDFNFECKFLKNDFYFDSNKEKRDIYEITLKRGTRNYTFNFGQSINCSGEYKGHKHLCLNTFGKYLFTKNEIEKLNIKNRFSIEYNEIVLNPNFKKPTLYDILACLTKYNPCTFENFCSEFGCDEDSRKAYKTYTAVKEEYMNMCILFNDEELELLSLIN